MTDLQGKCLVEIAGGGCAGCEAVMPVARAVADEFGLKFVRIEAEECGKLIERWGIEKLPATVLCDGDNLVCKCYGYQPQEILELFIEENLRSERK